MIVRSSTESGLLPGFAWRANRALANDLLIEERPAHTRRGKLNRLINILINRLNFGLHFSLEYQLEY